ncbi:MAG: PEP-CTERM sorting domain-containing protein [Candidatus Korobacteraceae bacterium]
MKTRFLPLTLLTVITFAVVACIPAAAQTLYENGPINGNTDAWTINLGFVMSDSFTISTGNSTITGMSFGAWLGPGDILDSVEISLTSQANGGTLYFDGIVSMTQSGCVLNRYDYDVCTETGIFNGPTLNNGTYWVNLQNAVDNEGQPVYWDENSGIGCHSPGCPSEAGNGVGSDPSEAFSILGTASTTTTGSVPEPTSLALFASGVVGAAALLRRKLF